MSLSVQSPIEESKSPPLLDLAPSADRVDRIDAGLRTRLAESLKYLQGAASFDSEEKNILSAVEQRLNTGPVSPWVFCLYSRLVAELSNNPQDAAGTVEAIQKAASLPPEIGVIGLRDSSISPSWWEHFQLLLDTDREHPFRPVVPSDENVSHSKNDIAQALELMAEADPAWHDEVKRLLRMIVLGSPASDSLDEFFNGASSFFLWGAALLNADLARSPISMVDLLVHESSHVLLFGLAANGGLTRNSGKERYKSPVRSDERPIEGIFHACFVTTRVHLVMQRLLDTDLLSKDDTTLAAEYRQYNGNSARESLEMLHRHAELTERGADIFDVLRAYWETSS